MITRYSYLLGVVLTNRRDLLPKGCCRLCCYGLLIGRCIDNYSQEIVWHNISNAIAHRFFVQFKSMFVLKYHTRFKTFVRLIRLLSFIIIWVSFSVIQVLRYFYVMPNTKGAYSDYFVLGKSESITVNIEPIILTVIMLQL